MAKMNIAATKFSPKVELKPEGILVIEGRSILEDPIAFYTPIIEEIKNIGSSTFTFEVRIEYMNTSSSKLIFNILKSVRNKFQANDISIKWYYEEDDEDMLEMGKDYESLLLIPFNFYEYTVNES
jgi:hypothetical protein